MYKGDQMAHKRYSNTDPAAQVKTWKEVRKWQKERKGKMKDLSSRVGQAEHKQAEMLRSNVADTTITWIGHSTFLLQMGGLTIVTDPVWAMRMGFARRLEAPGLTLDEIPPIDVILLSHAHYDHLHIRSLRKLKGTPVMLVPEGLGPKIRRIRKGTVIELPWWGKTEFRGLQFHFVPAQHWTRRTLTVMSIQRLVAEQLMRFILLAIVVISTASKKSERGSRPFVMRSCQLGHMSQSGSWARST
jgi:hypothetical protein